MQTELDTALAAIFADPDNTVLANKVYSTLLRTPLFVPTQKLAENAEEFQPLFVEEAGSYFIQAFDSVERFENWVGETKDQISCVTLLGRELILGMGAAVFLCINFGTPYYKEFNPEEIQRLKVVIEKTTKPFSGGQDVTWHAVETQQSSEVK